MTLWLLRSGAWHRVLTRLEKSREDRQSRRSARRFRQRRAFRPTRDLRLIPVGLVAWGTSLLTAGGVFPRGPDLSRTEVQLGAAVLLIVVIAGCWVLFRPPGAHGRVRPDRLGGRASSVGWTGAESSGGTGALVGQRQQERLRRFGRFLTAFRATLPTLLLCLVVATGVSAVAWQQNVRAAQAHDTAFDVLVTEASAEQTVTVAADDQAGHDPKTTTSRIELEIIDRPVAWQAEDRFQGEATGESGSGVVVQVQTAEGVPATVFARDSRWRAVRAGDVVDVVVTAQPPTAGELVLRTSGPPQTSGRVDHGAFLTWLEDAKARFMAATLDHGSDTSSLLPGMTYGDRSGFDPALEQAMKDTGLTHLTAVSGSNCALVMLLTGHLGLALGVRRKGCIALGLGALGVFVLLVGPDPSVLRAAVMGSVAAAGVLAGRSGTSLAALSAAMCLLLLADPSLGLDFGFALSVCATAGIIVTGRPLIRSLDRWLPAWVATLIAVPVVAQLWCAPVLTLLTPVIPVWSVPANALVAPVVPLVTVNGLLALLALGIGGPFGGHLGAWLMIPGSWLVRVVAEAARGFAGLPGAVAPWWEPPVGPAVMAAVSSVMIVAIHRWDRRNTAVTTSGRVQRQPAPGPVDEATWNRVRSRTVLLRWSSIVLAAVCGVSLVVLWLVRPAPPADWQAVACDVGQGDALLLRGREQGRETTVLIDAGPDPAAVRACLRSLNVVALDLLILTHDHADHVAGAAGLPEYVAIQRVWWSSGTGRPPHEIEGWEIPAEVPAVGTVLDGAGLRIEVLGPLTDPVPSVDSGTENNASLVIRADVGEDTDDATTDGDNTGGDGGDEHGGQQAADSDGEVVGGQPDHEVRAAGTAGEPRPNAASWLSAGDLEEDGARRLIGHYGDAPGGVLDVDVLKISHHGARNGGTAIIDAASPSLAVVSVGAENTYGHPHPTITGYLNDLEVPLARTDQLGQVGVFVDDDVVTARAM